MENSNPSLESVSGLKRVAGSEFTNKHGEPCYILVDEHYGEFYWTCPQPPDGIDDLEGPFETVEEAKDDAKSAW